MHPIKKFISGSAEEREAVASKKALDQRENLSYDEALKRDEVSGIVMKLRARQAGLVALLAAGMVCGFSLVERETGAVPEHAETVKVETRESFTVGPFEFVKDPSLSSREFKRFETIFQKAYPEFQKYLPLEPVVPKQIKVQRSSDGISQANYHKGEVMMAENVSDGLLLHELTHLLHGTNDLNYDLVEEGLATAISILITNQLGMESWDRTLSLQVNDEVTESLPLDPHFPYASNPALMTVRLEKSADFWMDLEKQRPGFIKAFHEAYYAYLREGGDKKELYDLETMEKVLKKAGLFDLFERTRKEHPIAQVPENQEGQAALRVMYMHFSNDDSRQLLIHIAKNRGEKGEGVWKQPILKFQLVNLDTGKQSEPLMTKSSEKGTVTIKLDDPKRGRHFLRDQVGEGKRYKIIVSSEVPEGKLEEEFEFDYL